MWPFGKKKEKAQPQTDPNLAQIQAFAQQFSPEEFTILAVTGFTPFGGIRSDDSQLWEAGITLTAWMEQDGEEIHRQETRLVTLADDRLYSYLRSHIPSNFILKIQVRAAKDDQSFQLIGMPEPGFDPDLKAILNEQKKPVTMDSPDFGTFTLIRGAGWFDAEAVWNGVSTRLLFDSAEEAEPCLNTARNLFADPVFWDGKIRSYTASHMLATLNTFAGEGEEPLTAQELSDLLDPDSILVRGDGTFEFWYGNGGVFWGQLIRVCGSLGEGITAALLAE